MRFNIQNYQTQRVQLKIAIKLRGDLSITILFKTYMCTKGDQNHTAPYMKQEGTSVVQLRTVLSHSTGSKNEPLQGGRGIFYKF